MTLDLLRVFAVITHEIAAERDQERADHAETAKLAQALQRDLARKSALLAESEAVRRGQADELRQLRQGAVLLRVAPRPHHGPPVRCQCGMTHSHEQATALNAGRSA